MKKFETERAIIAIGRICKVKFVSEFQINNRAIKAIEMLKIAEINLGDNLGIYAEIWAISTLKVNVIS
ncbi:hypothetical protein [Aquiflexum sp.]|uniref:hypothetical protein n=1 Tax=Aquiflexum sp. TaxID=1872584 RepID=UPI003592FFDB